MNNPTPTAFKDNGIAISQIGPYQSDPSKWETDVYQLLPVDEVKRTREHAIQPKHFNTPMTLGRTKTGHIGNGTRIEKAPISTGHYIYDLLPQ